MNGLNQQINDVTYMILNKKQPSWWRFLWIVQTQRPSEDLRGAATLLHLLGPSDGEKRTTARGTVKSSDQRCDQRVCCCSSGLIRVRGGVRD